MIEWTEIDSRLDSIGKNRRWLSEQTPYSADTIRTALAPNSTKRSARMLAVLSRAIEDEEAKSEARQSRPGMFDIFLTEEQLDKADRASRLVGAPSLVQFCRDAIFAAAERILREEATSGRADSARKKQTAGK